MYTSASRDPKRRIESSGLQMSVQGIRGICRNRRQVHRNLRDAQRFSKGLFGLDGIAADKLTGPIHHHLRSVDAVQAEALGVSTLPLTVEAGRIRILPADILRMGKKST